MFYDHRARSVQKAAASRIFPRVVVRRNSNFARKDISRYPTPSPSLPPSPPHHSLFLSLLPPLTRPPTRDFELVRRRAAHTIAIGLRLHCYVLPCAPVYYYYRFSTLSFRDHKQVGVRRTMRRNNGRD